MGQSGVTPEYAALLEKGLKFQDHVTELFYRDGLPLVTFASKDKQLRGENMAGIEIKFDDNLKKTGNLYIETMECRVAGSEMVKSGIYRNDNSWLYAIGDYDTLFVFAKKFLQCLHRASEKRGYRCVEIATSKAFLLPATEAEKYAAKIFHAEDAK